MSTIDKQEDTIGTNSSAGYDDAQMKPLPQNLIDENHHINS